MTDRGFDKTLLGLKDMSVDQLEKLLNETVNSLRVLRYKEIKEKEKLYNVKLITLEGEKHVVTGATFWFIEMILRALRQQSISLNMILKSDVFTKSRLERVEKLTEEFVSKTMEQSLEITVYAGETIPGAGKVVSSDNYNRDYHPDELLAKYADKDFFDMLSCYFNYGNNLDRYTDLKDQTYKLYTESMADLV